VQRKKEKQGSVNKGTTAWGPRRTYESLLKQFFQIFLSSALTALLLNRAAHTSEGKTREGG